MLLLYFLRANLTSTLAPVVQSKVRLRDQHIERDSYLIYHIFSFSLLSPVLTYLIYHIFTLLYFGQVHIHGEHMCSRFGTVTRHTNDIRPFHQSLLPCSIIVVWDEAPLKEPIRFSGTT